MKFTLTFGSITLLSVELLTTPEPEREDWDGITYGQVLDLTDIE